jgi:hypothetical protein
VHRGRRIARREKSGGTTFTGTVPTVGSVAPILIGESMIPKSGNRFSDKIMRRTK